MITQTIVALDSLGRFLEETEPVVEHLSYNDHSMESFMRLMKVFNKVMILCIWCSPILLNPLTLKSHYSGFVIKFIIKVITHACLVL